MSGRRRWMVGAVAVVVVAAGSVVVVQPWATSPPSAKANEPAAVTVTAEVEQRVLESEVVTRGRVVTSNRTAVTASTVPEGNTVNVVTALPVAVGAAVAGGTVLVEVNGRPSLLWPSSLPLYRELRPEMTGPDVVAVQDALAWLGHTVPDGERSTFGPATRESISEVYRNSGYEPTYTLGSASAVDEAIASADREVVSARDAANAARANGVIDAAAEVAYDQAQAEASHVRAREGVTLRPAEFVAIAALGATVFRIDVQVGGRVEPGATMVTVGSADLAVELELTSGQANAMSDDVDVEVTAPGYTSACTPGPVQPAGSPAPTKPSDSDVGTDTSETSQPTAAVDGGAGEAATEFTMSVECGEPPPVSLLDADVQATIRTSVSSAPVLVVPATALTTKADGTTSVRDGDGNTVTVTVIGETDGFVAVEADALEVGDRVAVRRR